MEVLCCCHHTNRREEPVVRACIALDALSPFQTFCDEEPFDHISGTLFLQHGVGRILQTSSTSTHSVLVLLQILAAGGLWSTGNIVSCSCRDSCPCLSAVENIIIVSGVTSISSMIVMVFLIIFIHHNTYSLIADIFNTSPFSNKVSVVFVGWMQHGASIKQNTCGN
jgi:hypothetical protein